MTTALARRMPKNALAYASHKAHDSHMPKSDPLLIRWGKNLAQHRALFAPDGTPRTSSLDERMSQADCGALLDPPVHQSTVARWEAGLIEPRRTYKVQLAALYDVDADTLFPMTPGVAA